MNPNQYKTWVEISQTAVAHNINQIRSILNKKTKLFAVVKSNAYGHDLVLFSSLANKMGVDGFCVDSVIEGEKLRRAGINKPILVLGPTLPQLYRLAKEKNITLSISNFDALKAAAQLKNPPNFHLKIDTGLHRQGFYLRDFPQVMKLILNFSQKSWSLKNQKIKSASSHFFQGIYTHFAAAKNPSYKSYTHKQIKEIKKAIDIAKNFGFANVVVHASATAGAILYPEAHFDLVRIGIGLYGYWPERKVAKGCREIWGRELTLRPVLSWRALISEIKHLSPGDFVGYDRTLKVRNYCQAAVLPIGYWHGFPRNLSNNGFVLIKGKLAKVLGRVSMDLVVVGLPKTIKAKVGDTATILGKDGASRITALDIAQKAKTISYEIITRLNPLMWRKIV